MTVIIKRNYTYKKIRKSGGFLNGVSVSNHGKTME